MSSKTLPEAVLEACRRHRLLVATAESCTGGLIAAALTSVAGASDVVERGFVAYSNAAKSELLGVPVATIDEKGAVSGEVAAAMVQGALAHSRADLAVAVTGIAGPAGGSRDKPVGLVYLACARRGGQPRVERHLFGGDRGAIQDSSVHRALEMLRDAAA